MVGVSVESRAEVGVVPVPGGDERPSGVDIGGKIAAGFRQGRVGAKERREMRLAF
ncbi:MAG: hypothetical protein QOE61_488 [Micromonosporaceae bacterium]|nr:hypothetical protein [Micromonosporaceae bacterium]